jgi:hypothetical protein
MANELGAEEPITNATGSLQTFLGTQNSFDNELYAMGRSDSVVAIGSPITRLPVSLSTLPTAMIVESDGAVKLKTPCTTHLGFAVAVALVGCMGIVTGHIMARSGTHDDGVTTTTPPRFRQTGTLAAYQNSHSQASQTLFAHADRFGLTTANKIGSVSKLPTAYSVLFRITPNSKAPGWRSVLHLSATGAI